MIYSFFLLFVVHLFFFSPARVQQQSAAPSPTATSAATEPKKTNQRPAPGEQKNAEPFDKATVKEMAAQCVKLETETGLIEIELLPEAAPESVRNFLNLAATGAFDTTTFSRVVKDFVVQGGNLSTRERLTPELAERARRTVPD
ncbi:MAG: peptidylprolyl isomerase, partial [Acidobacteriota bacterium]|nr:peptidylprolyl isomerase [Acidobacteriota bacterium]